MTRVGIVVVSHSRRLADAAVALALEMVTGDSPPIAIAAGTEDGGTGTDAAKVADAIVEVSTGDGVLVIMDLGSAVLSAGLALEFLPDPSPDVRLSSGPFFEGLQSAVVLAAAGATLDEVEREAAGALAPKQAQLPSPAAEPVPEVAAAATAETPDATTEIALVNPDGLHARPAAALVAVAAGFAARVTVTNLRSGAGPASASSPIALATLAARQGDILRICASGTDAAEAVDAARRLVADGFGEGVSGAAAAPTTGTTSTTGRPLGVSPGRAAGPVVVVPPPIAEPGTGLPLSQVKRDSAASRIGPAVQSVAAALDELAGRLGSPAGDIIAATAAIARDPELADAIRSAIVERGLGPERAVWESVAAIAAVYRGGGDRLAARVVDLETVRDHLIAQLSGRPVPGIPVSSAPYVLAAVDLAPTDAAVLDPTHCLAIVTEQGGPTSHTAILARSLGIPAVVGAAGVTGIAEGTTVLVDGTTGEIVIDPTAEQLAAIAAAGERHPVLEPGSTADGHSVPLLANIGSADAVAAALAEGAEGIGLFRTEFSFLGRTEAPTVPEQIAAYRKVFAAFAGKKVVVRTLDAGADKPLPFVTDQSEPNPALGVRGYRTAAGHPQVLADQLAAIAAAAAEEQARVQVMAPMIATAEEAAEFATLCHGHGIAVVGVMVEIPAAAIMAREIFAEVDFVSLGTNDLTQYTMAADRTLGALAALGDPWQPSVLRLIRMLRDGAGDKPVGVCGEAAADPLLAVVLVGLGVTSLSMSPRSRGPVATALKAVTLNQCRRAAQAACAARTPTDAREAASAAAVSDDSAPVC
ncbi:MAG: phosphoenolpyruvate--protein phosphotransferase [Terrimesophilobacter sp.]